MHTLYIYATRRLWAAALLLLCLPTLTAQEAVPALSLDSCHAWAQSRHPTAGRYALTDQSEADAASNAAKGALPQLMMAGQATLQSATTHIPFTLPGIDLPEIAKDQYRLYAEAVQPLTDLLTVRDNVRLAHADAAAERSRVDVEMHSLKARVNSLFFGILAVDEQARLAASLCDDLRAGIGRADTAAAHGVALRSAGDALRAELLGAEQRIAELQATRRTYVATLALLIGRKLTDDVRLDRPAEPSAMHAEEIRRPELRLFESQKAVLGVRRRLLTDANLPHVSLFVQGGYGRPALNMLDNDFKPYALGGIRLSWNIAGLYTYRKQRHLLDVNARTVDVQRDAFLLETRMTLTRQETEMEKLRRLVTSDAEIIRLRERVKESARNQLQFGTATANDYIQYVNAEHRARLSMALHELQLLWEAYNHRTTLGE